MKILDISADNRHLSLYRGFVKISEGGEEIGRMPLDSITAITVSGHGHTYSHNLLARLAEDGTPLFICGKNYQPAGGFLPLAAHYKQTERIHAQINASKPLMKRLHRDIIRAKIRMQGAACALIADGKAAKPLYDAAKKVRAGDPDNLEGQAAAYYFPHVFGDNFLRDRDADGINAMLNFGYAVLRGCVARYITGAGFCPSLGIFHKNKLNAFCLADDMMEPYRPLTDIAVALYARRHEPGLNPSAKRYLAALTACEMPADDGQTHQMQYLIRESARTLADVYEGGRKSPVFPVSEAAPAARDYLNDYKFI